MQTPARLQPWTATASWIFGGLFILTGSIALTEPSAGGVAAGSLLAGAIILPPVTTTLRKVAPFLKPVWAPPLLAFVLAQLVMVLVVNASTNSSSSPTVGPVAKASSSQQGNEDDVTLYAAFVRAKVGDQMLDRKSAEFRDVMAYKTGTKLTFCGKVNGKNRLGGYAGLTPFVFGDNGILMGDRVTAELVYQECQGLKATPVPMD